MASPDGAVADLDVRSLTTLTDLLADGARRFPDAAALRDSAGRVVSHRELQEQAARTAGFLAGLGLDRTRPVGLLVDHRIESVVAMLGIIRAGHPYVPLHPRWPAARIAAIASQLGLECLFADASTRDRAAELPALVPTLEHVVPLDTDPPGLRPGLPAQAPEVPVTPGDLAYTIFTSGSTGKPKGVAVPHGPVVKLAEFLNRTFDVGPGDTLLQVTAFTFDLSVYDVFGGLAAGACLRILSDEELSEPARIAEVLTTEPITFWNSAPPVMQLVLPSLADVRGERGRLRAVFLSGDWIPVPMPDRIRAEFPAAGVVSLGGATENTVWSHYYVVEEVDPDWPSIPYGQVMPHITGTVLDDGLQPCPPGVAGDLYVGGECLAAGYLGDPGRTAERFVPDPQRPGKRMYATGDRAEWLPDGKNIRFLGRLDDQVKILGYRIELGDVQAALAACPEVRDCVVIAPGHGPGRRLVGFYVPAPHDGSHRPVRDRLREHLPPYMVPEDLIAVERLPLTISGKADRGALLTEYASLADASIRAAVGEAWTRVLPSAPRTVDEDFFEAGGDSLGAVRLARVIEELTGFMPELTALFAVPTVRALAAEVTRARKEAEPRAAG